MKRLMVFAMFTLGILAAGNAVAQQQQVRANVPFSFTVGNHVLTAGTYTIRSVQDNAIEIHSQGKRVAMLALAFDTVDQSKSGNVLVFEKHGDLYSLREILCAPQGMNLSLPVEHWKKNAYLQEAMTSPSDGTVLISAGN